MSGNPKIAKNDNRKAPLGGAYDDHGAAAVVVVAEVVANDLF